MLETAKARRERWKQLTEDFPRCQHYCPCAVIVHKSKITFVQAHGIWEHRANPAIPCHFPIFQECIDHLEIPGTKDFSKELIRKSAKQYPSLVGERTKKLLKEEN